MRDSKDPYGGVHSYGRGTQQPLSGVDRILADPHESIREDEAAQEAPDNGSVEPADVYHSRSQLLVVYESTPEFPSVRRVPIPPNPIVPPKVQRDAFAALGPI